MTYQRDCLQTGGYSLPSLSQTHHPTLRPSAAELSEHLRQCLLSGTPGMRTGADSSRRMQAAWPRAAA